ncbi:MAG: prepilin-type N-terminal cleavage/methylation domain-containing protein [Planctomycetes bacterium]|nr:prepilin-type N-terminal cleavage/methylation domain-containing protein [Planctomycetota bacterium]
MVANNFKCSKARGVTLVEIMIAILILTVAVIGASGFRYHTMLDARKADAQVTAARTGLLLCESWRGLNGSDTFDPVTRFSSDLNIQVASQGPSLPTGFTELGRYRIIIDGLCCWATLSWSDVSPGLRTLNVVIGYEQRNSGTQLFTQADRTFKMTVYVKI